MADKEPFIPGGLFGVRVAAWGGHPGDHFAFKEQFNQDLFGGNCGHGACSITFPANEENKALIKKYCGNPPIPIEKVKVSVPTTIINMDGSPVPDYDHMTEVEVYTVTVSWWPGDGGYYLGPTINSDGLDERDGVHHRWDPKWKDYINPEQRFHGGKLGRSKHTYGTLTIDHYRNLPKDSLERRYINLNTQKTITEKLQDNIDTGRKKFNAKVNEYKRHKKNKLEYQRTSEHITKNEQLIKNLEKARRHIRRGDNLKKHFTSEEIEDIKKAIYPKYKGDIDEVILTRKKLKDIDRGIENLTKDVKEKTSKLKSDTKKDKVKLSKNTKLSDTELMLLDRFIEGWRTDPKFGWSDTVTYKKGMEIKQEIYEKFSDEFMTLLETKKKEVQELEEQIEELGEGLRAPEINASEDKLSDLAYNEISTQFETEAALSAFNEMLAYLEMDNEDEEFDITKLEENLTKLEVIGINPYALVGVKDIDELFEDEDKVEALRDIIGKYADKFESLNSLYQLFDPLPEDEQLAFPDDLDESITINEELKDVLEVYCELLDIEETYAIGDKLTRPQVKAFIDHLWALDTQIEKVNPEMAQKAINFEIKIKEQISLYEEKIKLDEYDEISASVDALGNGIMNVNRLLNIMKDDTVITDHQIELADEDYNEMLEEIKDALNEIDEGLHEKYLNKDPLDRYFTKDQLLQIKADLEKEIKNLYPIYIDNMQSKSNLQAQDFESIQTLGLPPETELFIPLDTESGGPDNLENGLNLKGMLHYAHHRVSSGDQYDYQRLNCTDALSELLVSGAKTDYLKAIFNTKAWGSLTTPQLVVNNAERFLRDYKNSPNDNIFKRLARWTPAQKQMGKYLPDVLDNNKTIRDRLAAFGKASPFIILSASATIVKGMFFPYKTIRGLAGLVKYANSKNNILFKAFAYAAAGIGTIIMAPAAIIGTVISAPFKAVSAIVKRVKRRKLLKDKETHANIEVADVFERATRHRKQAELKDTVKNDLESKIRLIESKNPQVAISLFEIELKKGNIPQYSPDTLRKIESFIESKNHSKQDELLIETYITLLQESVKRVQLAQKEALSSHVKLDREALLDGLKYYVDKILKNNRTLETSVFEQIKPLEQKFQVLLDEMNDAFNANGLDTNAREFKEFEAAINIARSEIGLALKARDANNLDEWSARMKQIENSFESRIKEFRKITVGKHEIEIPSLNTNKPKALPKEKIKVVKAPSTPRQKGKLQFKALGRHKRKRSDEDMPFVINNAENNAVQLKGSKRQKTGSSYKHRHHIQSLPKLNASHNEGFEFYAKLKAEPENEVWQSENYSSINELDAQLQAIEQQFLDALKQRGIDATKLYAAQALAQDIKITKGILGQAMQHFEKGDNDAAKQMIEALQDGMAERFDQYSEVQILNDTVKIEALNKDKPSQEQQAGIKKN